ncbi:MAG: thioredoxin-disulfide reductase [Holosporaceae bacterium]|jgi:thioredoxin reductase (NADPH)|nr:thioredoxin-disulfide reductase [Holosporaceae bacterium]
MIDILIIGSGPAGCAAAIYAARAGRSAKIIVGGQPGGQLTTTSSIENYPGFPELISGQELMDKMRLQVENMGVSLEQDAIKSVDFSERPFVCLGESGISYESRAVIIATGASAKWLGISGEAQYRGAGVSSCATCDGFFFRNKDVAVVGGGNTAVEEAIYLTRFAKNVTLIHRRDQLRAEKIMQDRLLENSKVSVIWNSGVKGIVGDGTKVTELQLEDLLDHSETSKPIDGVFIAIGHKPATEIFKSKLDLNDEGYVLIKTNSTETSVAGVFAAGDVCDPIYRQAITSAGQGCMAALDANQFLA